MQLGGEEDWSQDIHSMKYSAEEKKLNENTIGEIGDAV